MAVYFISFQMESRPWPVVRAVRSEAWPWEVCGLTQELGVYTRTNEQNMATSQ